MWGPFHWINGWRGWILPIRYKSISDCMLCTKICWANSSDEILKRWSNHSSFLSRLSTTSDTTRWPSETEGLVWWCCEVDWVGYFCSASSFLNLNHVASRQRGDLCVSAKTLARVSGDNSGLFSPFVQLGSFLESSQKGRAGGLHGTSVPHYAQHIPLLT